MCVLLDDDSCDNQPYYKSAKRVYEAHNTESGSTERLAKGIVGEAPIEDAGKFWMSFRGMDSQFTEKVNKSDKDPGSWVTTPGAGSPSPEYKTSYEGRGNCFLGARCN
jgi:hypothetical protein